LIIINKLLDYGAIFFKFAFANIGFVKINLSLSFCGGNTSHRRRVNQKYRG